MKVEFLPDAERELMEAADRYEWQRPGLGKAFILEVERLAAMLSELPLLGENRRRPLYWSLRVQDRGPRTAPPAVPVTAMLEPTQT